MTTTATIETEIRYCPRTQDYDCYVTIDGKREYIGSATNYSAGEAKCREYTYHHYADRDTPEAAAQILLAVPDGTPEDDFSDVGPERAPRLAVNWNSAPAARLVPVADLHTLAQTDPATFRAKLAALSSADLRTQATLYAIYASMLCDREISAAETLEHFRLSIDVHLAERRSEDRVCEVIHELALTDAPAMIEFLRSHTDAQRAQLAGRFAAWLDRECEIHREPSHILKGWQALCVGAAASGLQIELADCLGFASGWDAVAALWRGADATVESYASL